MRITANFSPETMEARGRWHIFQVQSRETFAVDVNSILGGNILGWNEWHMDTFSDKEKLSKAFTGKHTCLKDILHTGSD